MLETVPNVLPLLAYLFPHNISKKDSSNISILRKLRDRDVMEWSKITAGKQESQDLNQGSLTAKSVLLTLNCTTQWMFTRWKFYIPFPQLPATANYIAMSPKPALPSGDHAFWLSKIKAESKGHTVSSQYC